MNIYTNFRKIANMVLLVTILLLSSLANSANAQCGGGGASYCTTASYNGGPSSNGMGISNVTYGNINNTTGNGSSYTDYTNISTAVAAGTSQSISVGLFVSPYYQHCVVFVDWNNNGDFTGSGETVFSISSATYSPVSGTVSCPAGTSSGPKRMRVASEYYGYGMPNSCYGYYSEFEDYTVNVVSAGVNIAALGVTSPTTWALGTNTLSIKYGNAGTPAITSASFGFSVSNGSNSTVSGVSVASISSGGTGIYTFATPINITTGNNVIKVWANAPNGTQPDAAQCNDTLTFSVGSYTINPLGSGTTNFVSFTAAATYLNTYGVSGPISFTVSPGTYYEQMILGAISGASATNTITFDGVDTSSRTISFTTGSSYTAVIDLNGSDYVTIKRLNIVNSNNASTFNTYYGVHMWNDADYNRILGCKIQVAGGTSAYYYAMPLGICGTNYYDSGNNGDYNTVDGNRMLGGYIGMSLQGNYNPPTLSAGNVVSNNRIENAWQYGLYAQYQSNFKFEHNLISMAPAMTSSYGMYVTYVGSTDITRNTVRSSYYGMYYYSYSYYNPSGRCNVTNNIITPLASATYFIPLYMSDGYNTTVSHNTLMNTTSGGYGLLSYMSGSGNRVNNNIIQVSSGSVYPLYIYYGSTSYFTSFDYNTLIAPTGTSNLAYFNASSYSNLAALKASNISFNQNNNEVQPIYVSASDFHISSGMEQARGMAGTGINVDIDGDPRCLFAPSIGADESGFVTAAPTAGFTVGAVYVNSPITFLNNYSSSIPMEHKWYINGVFYTSTTNLTNYTFTATGNYNISLKSTNCSGSDSTNIVITVVVPSTTPLSDFIASSTTVNPLANVTFTDLSSNGPTSWAWTVSPGVSGVNYVFTSGTNATSRNPVIYFITPGNFNICMQASNSLGQGFNRCKPNYIKVLAIKSLCTSPFSTKAATGYLYSSSGPNGGYGYNENCLFTIDACADSTFLNITKADFGSGTVDRFEIYEGGYVAGKSPVMAYAGNTFIGPKTIGVKGMMTVREVTDGTANNGTGIVATWYVKQGSYAAPTGSIIGSNTAYYCGSGILNFYSSSFNDPTYLYEWDFDNDGFVDATGVEGAFSFTKIGVDTIKLTISGCGGTLVVTKIVNVVSPPAPHANFTSNLVTATIVDTVQLMDISTGGVLTWNWTITGPGAVTYVGGTGATSRNPKIMASFAGKYTVKLIITNCTGVDSVKVTDYFKVLGYCTPTAGNLLPDLSIVRFTMGSIDNIVTIPLPGTVSFRDYSQILSTVAERGSTSAFTITRFSNFNAAGIRIWVDWNQDGTFDPITELAASTVTSALTWSSSIFTPTTAAVGGTRLRIGVAYNNMSNTPCGANQYGEFQDFRLNVTPDLKGPELTLGGTNPTYLEVGRMFTESGDVAVDAVDGIVTDSITYSNYLTGRGYQQPVTKQATAVGTFTVAVSAKDLSGNETIKTRTVIVTADTTRPVLTLNVSSPMYLEVYTKFVDPGVTATDLLFTTPITVTAVNNVDTAHYGTYTVTYTATDSHGNVANPVVLTVIVRDSEKPVIHFPANTDTVRVEVRTTYVDAGATVTDNYSSGLTATVSGSVNSYVPGTYYYTFNAVDASGNQAIPKVRVIIVADNTAPELVLAAPYDPDTMYLEVKMYTVVPEPGYVATDNYYPSSQITVTKAGTVDLNTIGTYVVTYQAIDAANNKSVVKRRIYKVIDSTKPVITITGSNSVNICRWRSYADAGATITDNYWTGLLISSFSNLNVTLPGIYTVTYNAIDGSGNVAATATRYLTVLNENSSLCQQYTGINGNAENNSISVTPNPSNGKITIDIAFDTESQNDIVIYNSLGQVVMHVDHALISKAKYTVDLQNEASGIYFVTVKSENSTITKKFVLNK